ncbi:MAG TPA: DUF4440 domain-containing protein [Acidobacteriaceae bacterium]|jgi:hypothetical protein|nr:DUF4440 domain-containing protein [Acidobacteriaceae bacterium]
MEPITRNAPELAAVMEELRRLEPIFHTAEFGTTGDDFERRMDAEYFEVGASGRRYSREFILRTLAERAPVDAATAGWRCGEFALRAVGAETYLLTYTLRQGERVTRRSTLWRRGDAGWQILYHQGTVVAAEEGAPGAEVSQAR